MKYPNVSTSLPAASIPSFHNSKQKTFETHIEESHYKFDKDIDTEGKKIFDKGDYNQFIQYIKEKASRRYMFSPETVIEIMIQTNEIQNFLLTYQIYQVYQSMFATNKSFIELSMHACFMLEQYKLVEELLNKYLTFEEQHARYITISIISYLRIRKVEVAKQLLFQFITAKRAVNWRTLQHILPELRLYASMSTIKFIVQAWIEFGLPITRVSYGLMLEIYLDKGTEEDIDYINKLLYDHKAHTHRLVYAARFRNDLKFLGTDETEIDEFFEKVDFQLMHWRNDKPEGLDVFYLKLMGVMMNKNNALVFQKLVERIELDNVESTEIVKLIIRYYSNLESFDEIVKYLKKLKENGKPFSFTFLSSLRHTFKYHYPHLLTYFDQVLLALYQNSSEMEQFFVKQMLQNVSLDAGDIDFMALKSQELINYIAAKPEDETVSAVNQMLRSGYVPTRTFLMGVFKLFLKRNDVTSALKIEKLMTDMKYEDFALKILWLQHEHLQYSHELRFNAHISILSFVDKYESKMTGEHYLQLAGIAYSSNKYELSERLALTAASRFQLNNKLQSIVYLNLIRAKFLLCDTKGIHELQKEMFEDSHELHPIIGHQLYNFHKKMEFSNAPDEVMELFTRFMEQLQEKKDKDSKIALFSLKDMALTLKGWQPEKKVFYRKKKAN